MEHGHVEALDDCELLGVRVDQVGEAVEDRRASLDAEGGPSWGGRSRCAERGGGRVRVAPRDLAEQKGPVDGGAVLEGRRGLDARSADVVVEGDVDATDECGPSRAHASNLGRTLG